MRILHLSDSHFSKENLNDLKQFYLTALLSDLKLWKKEKPISLVVVTGDLIDKGGESFTLEENVYDVYETEFINPIINELGISKSRFIMIPGNHDIQESKIEDISEDGILNLNDIKRINKYVTDYKNEYHLGIERIKAYKEFEKRFYNQINECNLSNFESCFVITIDGEKIGIAAFNSAWRSSTKLPKDKLLFGTQQILNANEYLNSQGVNLKIALIHHPIELISEIERHELLTFLYSFRYHVLLSGHTHKSEIIHSLGTRNNLFTSVAKTAFSDPRENIDSYRAGYSIIDLDKTLTGDIDISCYFRKYIHNRVAFDKDVDVSSNGEFKDTLKLSINDETFNKYLILTDKTYKAKQELINNSLVIHGTDSIAPRTINEIFVLPKLTEKPTLLHDIDEEVYLI